ncbi:MAG: hypothetical protein JWP81_5354 [Ferruginibacter sp.]|nr:hypothetical protein [Ferruginibacter sp.]
MNSLLKFNKCYFIVTGLVFGIEVLIARFAHDQIIRPYIGDLLVVVLMYCCMKSFLHVPVLRAAISVLLFSYVVEISQYFHLVNRLGLQHSKLARTVMGTSFAWLDLIAYTIGIVLILYTEKILAAKNICRKVIPT